MSYDLDLTDEELDYDADFVERFIVLARPLGAAAFSARPRHHARAATVRCFISKPSRRLRKRPRNTIRKRKAATSITPPSARPIGSAGEWKV